MVKNYNITNLLSDASIRDILEIIKLAKIVPGKKFVIKNVNLEVTTFEKRKGPKMSYAKLLAKADHPNFYNYIAKYYNRPFEDYNKKYIKIMHDAITRSLMYRSSSDKYINDFIAYLKAKGKIKNQRLAYDLGLLLNTTWLEKFDSYLVHIFKDKAEVVKVLLMKYQLTKEYKNRQKTEEVIL